MALEEILQEHIKALNENTRAIIAYTNALSKENKSPEVETIWTNWLMMSFGHKIVNN